MPKYELMYIIGSNTSDEDIPHVNDEVKKLIEKAGGKIDKFEELGKKKFAYPIKKTRTGHYVLVHFTMSAGKLNEVETGIRGILEIIRHLIVNITEALKRMERDRLAQAKLQRSRPQETEKEKTKPLKPTTPKKIDIDLDAEIEKAIEPEDLK